MKKLKRVLAVTGAILGASYIVMDMVAKSQKTKATYQDKPEERNPMEGKKVVFVEDENDPVNADGLNGHLESVGDSSHIPTVYEVCVKRGIDKLLSFFGMVMLAPVYTVTALAIKSDDPGPVLFKQKRVGQNKQYFELLKFRSMSVIHLTLPVLKTRNRKYIIYAEKNIRFVTSSILPLQFKKQVYDFPCFENR